MCSFLNAWYQCLTLTRCASPGVLPEDRFFWLLFKKFSQVTLYSKCLKTDLKPVSDVCCIPCFVNSFQLQLFCFMLALPWAKKAHLYWHVMIYYSLLEDSADKHFLYVVYWIAIDLGLKFVLQIFTFSFVTSDKVFKFQQKIGTNGN